MGLRIDDGVHGVRGKGTGPVPRRCQRIVVTTALEHLLHTARGRVEPRLQEIYGATAGVLCLRLEGRIDPTKAEHHRLFDLSHFEDVNSVFEGSVFVVDGRLPISRASTFVRTRVTTSHVE